MGIACWWRDEKWSVNGEARRIELDVSKFGHLAIKYNCPCLVGIHTLLSGSERLDKLRKIEPAV